MASMHPSSFTNDTPSFGFRGNVTQFDNSKKDLLVVIIDDQTTGRAILQSLVRKISTHVRCRSFSDPHEALAACTDRPPDLLITDYRMPIMNGVEVIRQFRSIAGCADVPIVVVSIVEDRDVRYTALEAGASDFLSRPFDHYECQTRCSNLLLLHEQRKFTAKRTELLEDQISQATQEVRKREIDALICLARAGEYRDEGTGNHIFRMAHYSLEIARGLGLDAGICDRIERAAPMHDIGKIGIPDSILLKPGPFTQSEREIMKTHTVIGHHILVGSASPYLQLGSMIALSHHEWFDGTGYPHGARMEEIPIESRIVAVADALDALTTNRPYKQAWSMEDSLQHIEGNTDTQFDPDCVKALLSKEEQIRNICSELPNTAN